MAQNGTMRRTLGLLVVAAVLVTAVVGCAPERGPLGEKPTSTDGQTATPTPSVTPTLGPDDIPLRLSCTEVVSDEVIYEWGSGNWGADPDYAVPRGSSAAEIVEHGGTACGWVNLTSGEKLSVAVGEFAPEVLEPLRAERAAKAEPVSAFGVDGYFAVTAGTGQADAFTGPYWISASSTYFAATEDALSIVQAALEAP